MGKMLKKGETGDAAKYISRNQAVKKLQISLADFRRLCILKGIYPREPKNKKKLAGGSTAPKTYYYLKDIQYVMHEPVLAKFREQKSFLRKLKKAMSKNQSSVVKSLQQNKPEYTLDHIVKERYPSFKDAVRDLDDCLSMIFLFATLPATNKVKSDRVKACQRLAAEFQHYVMISRSLRKVFLSIKGIYYQAEIKGEMVTWIVPWQFSQQVPTDVDFRVMLTFLEFYQTLLGFVNYRLYTGQNLSYPPKMDLSKEEEAAGLDAFIIETKDGVELADKLSQLETATEGLKTADLKKQNKVSARRLKNLDMSKLEAEDEEVDGDEDDMQIDNAQEQLTEAFGSAIDDFSTMNQELNANTTNTNDIPTFSKSQTDQITSIQNLFSTCVFYLSREVPRYSLEFVVKAFGGRVGWDETLGGGSPYSESDPRITHNICDRPTITKTHAREYVQPQWVYDCINAGKLVKVSGHGVGVDGKPVGYVVGEALPPHLSPFVEYKEGDYVPDEAKEDEDVPETLVDHSEGDEVEEEEEEEIAEEEETYQRDMEAELTGSVAEPTAASKKRKSVSTEAKKAQEQKELAIMMMSKKDRRLWNQIQYGKNKKQKEVEKLAQKREALAGEVQKVKKVKTSN